MKTGGDKEIMEALAPFFEGDKEIVMGNTRMLSETKVILEPLDKAGAFTWTHPDYYKMRDDLAKVMVKLDYAANASGSVVASEQSLYPSG